MRARYLKRWVWLQGARCTSRGFTLVELFVLLVVLGVLAAMATQVFSSWIKKYNAEDEIKKLYSDLMGQRAYAMTRSRVAGIKLINATSYSFTEDLDDNGVTEGGEENLRPVQLKSSISWNGSGSKVEFNSLGVTSNQRTIRIIDSSGAGYDCIVISATRINMGKYDGGECKAK